MVLKAFGERVKARKLAGESAVVASYVELIVGAK